MRKSDGKKGPYISFYGERGHNKSQLTQYTCH